MVIYTSRQGKQTGSDGTLSLPRVTNVIFAGIDSIFALLSLILFIVELAIPVNRWYGWRLPEYYGSFMVFVVW